MCWYCPSGYGPFCVLYHYSTVREREIEEFCLKGRLRGRAVCEVILQFFVGTVLGIGGSRGNKGCDSRYSVVSVLLPGRSRLIYGWLWTEDLRALLFPVELRDRASLGAPGYVRYLPSDIACPENTQPYGNNGFACSRALSCVTMSMYAGAL